MLDVSTAWGAVVARDATYDGEFVYAVSTTGVYCRPSCPSRKPRRDNASFFPDSLAAAGAGFRACLRCHPDGAPIDGVIANAINYLETNLERTVTLGELGGAVGMGATHLQRRFIERVGVSPREYVRACRLERFKATLRESPGDVLGGVFDAGFGSASAAYAATTALTGMTPATYGTGGAGASITFAIVDSPFGLVLVAITGSGVCAVTLGDDALSLERSLRLEYPRAEISRDDAGLAAAAGLICASFDDDDFLTRVPLDVRATAFQWRVWRRLREIPRGSTQTYAEVASAIGSPRAVRAVAGACARNQVAMLIPCHRVVRTDGGFGGYRWGVGRKAELLDRERPD